MWQKYPYLIIYVIGFFVAPIIVALIMRCQEDDKTPPTDDDQTATAWMLFASSVVWPLIIATPLILLIMYWSFLTDFIYKPRKKKE